MNIPRIQKLVIASSLLMACGEEATAPTKDLVGLWNLPYQESPAIYGLVSAQVVFDADGTFLFQGLNPQSMAPVAEFTVTGTWNRSGSLLTLVAGDDASVWQLTRETYGRLRFTATDSRNSFRLIRPGSD